MLRNVFDTFDGRNQGKFSVEDLNVIVESMGGDAKKYDIVQLLQFINNHKDSSHTCLSKSV